MSNINDYLGLITSEHQDKPKFLATVQASVEAFVGLQNTLFSLPGNFDIDTAIGVQLDVLGEWIGRSRYVSKPITGVYFEWDGDGSLGWQKGVWQGQFDPSSGIVSLPDENYRTLLKAKIVANSWSGSIQDAYAIWASIFKGTGIFIQDNQNMTMVIGIVGQYLDALSLALLVQGYIPIKPEGVGIDFFAVLPDPDPRFMFMWDANYDLPSAYSDGFDLDTPEIYFGGWDQGQWPQQINPTL